MLNRERAQNVPGSAPAGNYLYQAHVGDYPSVIWNSDSFGFVKLGSTPDGDTVDWSNSGESFAQGAANLACVSQKPPDQFVLCGIYPNPFNATTTIAFALPEAAWVNLQIYDISGKKVASLMEGWQSAGKQQISFDGAHLASGIYLYHVEMGNYKTSGKIALIK